MVFTLPVLAIPYTSVPKISGAMMDLIRRRNTLASGGHPVGFADVGKRRADRDAHHHAR